MRTKKTGVPRQSGGVPRYAQICRNIVGLIRSGRLGPGAQVPSENEIMMNLDVSNTTARRALAELERAGWVERIKGRGTYVRAARVERSINRILGFTRNIIEAGRNPSTRLLTAEVVDDDHEHVLETTTYRLHGPHCRIRRLRLADDVPVMLETRYISLELCPGIQDRKLDRSLYEIYEKEYGLHLTEVEQVVGAEPLAEKLLGAFGLDETVTAFRVEGVTFCGKGMLLETEESLYRADIYRFRVKATREGEVT